MCLVGKRILPQLELAEIFDIVWDTDLIYRLKSSVRQVKMTSKTPGHIHWKAFLRAVSNKDVYDILAGDLQSLDIPGVNYATDSWKACVDLCTNGYISVIYPSSQQVADYRMVSAPTIHSDKDMKAVLLQVSDTDVVGIVTL